MTDFYIELIGVGNETFKQSFDEYVVGFEAGWFCEDEMKTTIIRLTDQLRLLDQDMIRLKEKVNTVLQLKENDKNQEQKNKKK